MRVIKKYWRPLVFAWIVYIFLFMVVTMGGGYITFTINIVLNIILFGIMTYLFRKKTTGPNERLVKTILLASPVIAFLLISILKPDQFLMAPNTIISPAIGILLGFIYEKSESRMAKPVILVLPLVIGIWIYLSGADIWQHYIIYRTFKSGATLEEAPVISFRKDSTLYTNEDFKGRIPVFYIWNTTCPYDLRFFPELKEEQLKWAGNDRIEFFAVNIPLKSDTIGLADEVLKNNDLQITNLIGPAIDESYKVFGEFTFPLTIILNPEGKMVFRGAIDRIDKTLGKLTD